MVTQKVHSDWIPWQSLLARTWTSLPCQVGTLMLSKPIQRDSPLSQGLALLWKAGNSPNLRSSPRKTRWSSPWTLSQLTCCQKISSQSIDTLSLKAWKSLNRVAVSAAQIAWLAVMIKTLTMKKSRARHKFNRNLKHWESRQSVAVQGAWRARLPTNHGTTHKEAWLRHKSQLESV